MSVEIDMKEDGEIESEEEAKEIGAYRIIERPKPQHFQQLMDSDSEDSNLSDESVDEKKIAFKPKPHERLPSNSQKISKNAALWKEVSQEQSLLENLKSCDVSRKRKYERGAESYDYENAKYAQEVKDDIKKRLKMENSDSSSSTASNKPRKIRKARHRNRANSSPIIIEDITVSGDSSDKEFGKEMAKNLEEEKWELIVRVVSVLGRDESLRIFKTTQKIERNGGMLTFNRMRRRTPGGIFLFLIKTSSTIDERQKKEIFDSDQPRETDPPPSPASEELHAKNDNPDPNLVSQKILNVRTANVNEEVLNIDYNSDMETV